MSKGKRSLVGRYFEDVLRRGNVAAAEELLAPEFTFQGLRIIEGVEDFMQYVLGLHTAFPDLSFIVEDEVSDGRRAAGRYAMWGRHRGDFLGIPATGNRVEVRGMVMLDVAGGRIAEIWDFVDTLALMRQVGAIPRLGKAVSGVGEGFPPVIDLSETTISGSCSYGGVMLPRKERQEGLTFCED